MFDRIESIVRESGRRVRDAVDFTVEDKGTKENLVTSADLDNELFLKRELTSLIPGSVFKGEEGDDNDILDKGFTWIVDPIDGTANFAMGVPIVGISVALFKDGLPFIGFVNNPFTDTLWSAQIGKGAYKNGRPMHVSARPASNGLFCTAWSCYNKALAPGCFRVSEKMYEICNDIRRTGSAACELAMLAEGAVDLYFEVRLSPWDHAAALICVKEAGGVFCGIEGPVDFNKPSPVLAANNQANLDIIKRIVTEEYGDKTPY